MAPISSSCGGSGIYNRLVLVSMLLALFGDMLRPVFCVGLVGLDLPRQYLGLLQRLLDFSLDLECFAYFFHALTISWMRTFHCKWEQIPFLVLWGVTDIHLQSCICCCGKYYSSISSRCGISALHETVIPKPGRAVGKYPSWLFGSHHDSHSVYFQSVRPSPETKEQVSSVIWCRIDRPDNWISWIILDK